MSDVEFVDNPGRRPGRAKGKRVRVQLRGEEGEPYEPIYASDSNNQVKLGWAADDTRWTFSRDDDPCRRFDVIRFAVLR